MVWSLISFSTTTESLFVLFQHFVASISFFATPSRSALFDHQEKEAGVFRIIEKTKRCRNANSKEKQREERKIFYHFFKIYIFIFDKSHHSKDCTREDMFIVLNFGVTLPKMSDSKIYLKF